MIATPYMRYDPHMLSAILWVNTLHRSGRSIRFTFSYCFADTLCLNTTASTQYYGVANATSSLQIYVHASDGATLRLEPVDFVWNSAKIKDRAGDYRNGQKGAIVELFGWPHVDVEQECSFLASAGYLGVKLFPIQEQVPTKYMLSNDAGMYVIYIYMCVCVFGGVVLKMSMDADLLRGACTDIQIHFFSL